MQIRFALSYRSYISLASKIYQCPIANFIAQCHCASSNKKKWITLIIYSALLNISDCLLKYLISFPWNTKQACFIKLLNFEICILKKDNLESENQIKLTQVQSGQGYVKFSINNVNQRPNSTEFNTTSKPSFLFCLSRAILQCLKNMIARICTERNSNII